MLQQAKPSTDESVRTFDPFEDLDALWQREADDVQEGTATPGGGARARQPGVLRRAVGARGPPDTGVIEPADTSPAVEGGGAQACRLLPI